MKLAKRIIPLVAAFALALCMGAVAFAEETYTDVTSVTVKKVYKLVGNGSSPAEIFTLEQVGSGVVKTGDATSAPDLGTITGATFNAGDASTTGKEGTITITLPTYEKVGVYEYTLKETAEKNAGVAYHGDNIKLVVTVINGESGLIRIPAVHTETQGDKTDKFDNTYSAGTLKVSKTVTGNLGDKSKYFEFKVKLTGVEGKIYADSFAVTGGSYESNPQTIKLGEETTFYLKHGETISIANLPYGVGYTVTETAAEGYTTTKTGDTGTINAAAQTADFTNEQKGDIDTGVVLSSLPYVAVLAVVVLGSVALVVRKRRANEE